MAILAEFRDFLEEYGVVGLVVAFVIGLAVKDFVSATVDDIVMPIVGVFLPAGDWQNATLTVASIEFLLGHFLAALIDFLIIAFLVFVFVRYVLPEEESAEE